MRSIRQYLLALALGLAGCGSTAAGQDATPVFCVPGHMVSCQRLGCLDDGVQICEPDGSGYGGCICDSVPADGGSGDALPQTDAEPTTDAEPASDALPQTDAEPASDVLPQTDAEPCLENQPCNGAQGICHNGACCEGCWDGAQCQVGYATAACGGGGGACADCGTAATICQLNECAASTRTCRAVPQNNGSNCASECYANIEATCQSGQCRPTDVTVCRVPGALCLAHGTCDISVTPHLCRGGCCDGLVCGYF